jgi:GNAT superfamily N-acetyltransferase
MAEPWLELYGSANGYSARELTVRRGILERIRARPAFAQAWLDGAPVGVGRGVLDGEWLGIFCMATRPEFRRRGVGRAVLGALARWAHDGGACASYLQVMDENAAACALYAGLGWKTLYDYHYREAAAVGVFSS